MPLMVAVILFNKNPSWLHKKTVNKGTLISTNLNLQQLKLIPNKPIVNSFNHTWLLFYLTTFPCSKLCQNQLYQMRHIILALGKYRYQIQYGLVLIQDNPLATHSFPNLNKDVNLLIYTISKQHAQKIFFALNNHNVSYFIADPFGRIILYYPNNATSEDIYHDLMRLLTISTTG